MAKVAGHGMNFVPPLHTVEVTADSRLSVLQGRHEQQAAVLLASLEARLGSGATAASYVGVPVL